MITINKTAPTEAASRMIEKLIRDGLYKGFNLIDIRNVSELAQPRAAIRKFAQRWAKSHISVESIGWRWLGTPGEKPTLLVAYTGRISQPASFQMCKYVFGGKR